MTDELGRLEREVEEAMRSLPAEFSVEIPAALVMRVKAVVRHEVNEGWLNDQGAPLPSAEAMLRTHEAVRNELARPAKLSQPSAWGRMVSALGAAAMIAISVGVIWVSGTRQPGSRTTPPEVVAAEKQLEKFMAAAEKVLSSESLTDSLYDDLDTIEEDIDGWRTAGAEPGGLGDVVSEIDSKLSEPDESQNVSQISVVAKGGLG